jgi:hypothetical protein
MISQIIHNRISYKYGTNNLNKKIVSNTYKQAFVKFVTIKKTEH